MRKNYLLEYIEELPKKGIYYITKKSLPFPDKTEASINLAINRLLNKNKLIRIKKDFYVIVPVEYNYKKIFPDFYIDQLMNYLSVDYYISTFTSAMYLGSSHQAVQNFYVTTPVNIKNIDTPGTKIIFLKSKNFFKDGIQEVKSRNGYIKLSSPELTIYDLIKYKDSLGGLNRTGEVIYGLLDKIKVNNLLNLVNDNNIETSYLQRMGYILEQELEYDNLTHFYNRIIKTRNLKYTLLDNKSSVKDATYNKKWQIIVNTILELELS